jgi:hypothetical protein
MRPSHSAFAVLVAVTNVGREDRSGWVLPWAVAAELDCDPDTATRLLDDVSAAGLLDRRIRTG